MLKKMIFRKRYIRKKFAKQFYMSPDAYSNIDFVRERLDEIGIFQKQGWDIRDCKNESIVSGMDDVTWNDLEMDEIFLRLNHTRSFVGEQIMYQKLRDLEPTYPNIENHITFIANHPEKRIDIEQRLCDIGKHRNDYYLPMILRNPTQWKINGNLIFKLLQFTLIACGTMALILGSQICARITLLIAIINLTISMVLKMKYEALLFCVGSIRSMIQLCQYIEKDSELCKNFLTEELKDTLGVAKRITKYIGNFQIRRNNAMSGDLAGLLLDYILGFLLYDVITYGKIITFLEKHNLEIIKLYEFIGTMDMNITIASFRARVGEWCVPSCSNKTINVKNMRYPGFENCVPNDILIKRGVMLTGANASGKSTFMKALAINVILSKTINTACAASFSIPFNLGIMSSMALRDDILTGESYYIKEINQLKQMLGTINQDTPMLLIIDEILKGTNSIERVAASYGILEYLKDKNVYVVVATHDISLVEMVKDEYQCYYFSSDIMDDKIIFDYKLHKGINDRSNAIQLLEYSGFPEDIIESSKAQLKKAI